MQAYQWLPISELPIEKRKYDLKVFVCCDYEEETCGYNFPQSVIWKGDCWRLTHSHEKYTKLITHYLPIYLTNGKLSG